MNAADFDELSESEKEHFYKCGKCGEMVDKRHLDEVWRGIEVVVREMNAFPGVQAWWRLYSHWFDEEFAKFINQQQQTATRHSD